MDTEGTEEEAEEHLDSALGMEADEAGKGKGALNEGGEGNPRELGDLEFFTQDAELSGTMLVDTRNGFNELSRLAMLWTVRHCWPAGARFAFNCYKNWAQLILHQTGDPPVTILSREGVNQGYPLSMVLYGITLAPLA